MKSADETTERRVELVRIASSEVGGLLEGAANSGIRDGEMHEYWALLTIAVLTLGASMEGAEWMEAVVKKAVDAAKADFDAERSKEAGRN